MHGGTRTARFGTRIGILYAVVACLTLLGAGEATAQGMVTPSFGDGELVVVAEGYRPGEHVELIVRTGGAAYQFAATADAHGCFRLATGLAVPPLSSIEIEARDEQGQTQATLAAGGGGLPLPPVHTEGPTEDGHALDPDMSSCVP